MRKSPCLHSVHSHVRSDGDRVRSYTRGRGQPLGRSYQTRTVLPKLEHDGKYDDDKESFSKSHELRKYTVNLKYVDGSKETVKVEGHSPEESIHEAMKKVTPQHRQERPVEVTSRNLLGDIVGRLAAWGVGGAKKLVQTYKEVREKAKPGEIERAQRLAQLRQRRKKYEQYAKETE